MKYIRLSRRAIAALLAPIACLFLLSACATHHTDGEAKFYVPPATSLTPTNQLILLVNHERTQTMRINNITSDKLYLLPGIYNVEYVYCSYGSHTTSVH